MKNCMWWYLLIVSNTFQPFVDLYLTKHIYFINSRLEAPVYARDKYPWRGCIFQVLPAKKMACLTCNPLRLSGPSPEECCYELVMWDECCFPLVLIEEERESWLLEALNAPDRKVKVNVALTVFMRD